MTSGSSSSAVRNLRSLFENKGSETSPDTRGRSSFGLPDKENNRPTSTSKVRASFVSVDSPGGMASTMDAPSPMPELKRESSAGLRRGSFSEKDGDEGLLELKKTVSQEAERREKDSSIAEPIPESAAESADATPLIGAENDDGQLAVEESPLAHKEYKEPANPDKQTTAVEEELGDMQPADPASENAVSGGEALPPVAEDLRPSEPAVDSAQSQTDVKEAEPTPAKRILETASNAARKSSPRVNGSAKPSPMSNKAPSKATSGPTKPQSRVPSSATGAPSSTEPHKDPAKKSSRSSLTAPTAASVARAAAHDKQDSKSSDSSKPKPRENTKPVDLPARLTAPTAASKAKHDPSPTPSASSTSTLRSSTSSRPKPPPASGRPTPRSSLGTAQRSEPRASQPAAKKAAPAADGSFLERMMRPTAASASKTHGKIEPKSPPRANKTAPAHKPKINGHAKEPVPKTGSRPSTAKSAGTEPATADHATHEPQEQSLTNGESAETHAEEFQGGPTIADPKATVEGSKEVEPVGNETPIPHTNGEQAEGALEATPAFSQD